MVLINIGVHKLESYKNSDGVFENSFFLQRPYLNYLIYSPRSIEMFYDYFSSKGGVGKQIYTNASQVIHSSHKAFNKYGASALITNPKKQTFNPDLKIEYYGEDFIDKDIEYPWKSDHDLHWFIIRQKNKNFLITDEHIILSEHGWQPNPKYTYDDHKVKLIEDIQKCKIDYLLPRNHVGDFYLQKMNKNSIKDSIQYFKQRL